VLVLGLHFAVSLATSLIVKSDYKYGSQDAQAFAVHVAVVLGLIFVRCFSTAAVVSASLARGGNAASAISSVLLALPTLLPIWLADSWGTIWWLWDSWTGLLVKLVESQDLSVPPSSLLLAIRFVQTVGPIASVALLGLLSPVVLAERRKLFDGVFRTWRLMSGARWRVVALYVMVTAALFACASIDGAIQRTFLRGAPPTTSATFGWAMTAVYDCVGALWSVMAASAYLELRRVKEGEPAEEVAQVFA